MMMIYVGCLEYGLHIVFGVCVCARLEMNLFGVLNPLGLFTIQPNSTLIFEIEVLKIE